MPELIDVASGAAGLAAPGSEECCVAVAVKLRPLVPSEVEQGCRECLTVTPGVPQVSTGQHTFTYDHVFGGLGGQDASQLYTTCVAPLVDGLFKGYNATVFAYGQTGSGKTYTMGSEYRPGGHRTPEGVIPEAIAAIFAKIAAQKDHWQCSVRVSFVEIHKEEVRDLLVSTSGPRPAVSIREALGGGVTLYGAAEREVHSQEEMVAVLEMGTLCRSTASTSMNNRSSRSHAIFTITLEQRRVVAAPTTPGGSTVGNGPGQGRGDDDEDDDGGDGDGEGEGEGEGALEDYLCAKMHLVDLAGSERAKRTKAEGARLKEGIYINRGLLALGNVINAIVDAHKHIPYRDSKLTRLLQDSLGGNSRTVMIACVSPADVNFEESLNTLRYADRARHIRNKPTINRDPVAAQVAFLRQQIAALRSENLALRAALTADGKSADDAAARPGNAAAAHWAIVEQLQAENTSLELDNTRLKIHMEEMGQELEAVKERCYLLQASLDRTTQELRLLRGEEGPTASGAGGGADGGPGPSAAATAQDMVIAAYVARVAELERELRAARQFGSLRRRLPSALQPRTTLNDVPPSPAGGDGVPRTPDSGAGQAPFSPGVGNDGDLRGSPRAGDEPGPLEEEGEGVDEEIYYAEMAAHALEQEKMKAELSALQRLLEAKERRMAELQSGSGEVPALKQHYDRVLSALQSERDELMSEKIAIVQKLQHLQAASEEERRRIEATYREKLAAYDDKLRALRHKEREFVAMQRLKQRTEDMCRRLSGDIARIKQQKVALQKAMETSAKQFHQWRHDREKELVQLRKQARRSAAQIQALEAMQAKQNAVLQRKIADANAARKKLRELQTATSDRHREPGGGSIRGSAESAAAASLMEVQPNERAPVLRSDRSRRDWLEQELDLCNQSHEYRRVLEGELAQRADVNRQLRNVMKRLMMVNNLVPASPLVAGPAGSTTPYNPNQVGDVVVAQLLERKAQLERQLAEHNTQITELQGAWERARAEEEGRGGGASDAKRWAGIRNAVEARELLKGLFKLASDHKAAAADSALEGLKLMEELDLLRVQLDAARKEAEAQRKRAAAIEATAATAMGSPYPVPISGRSSAQRVGDETDIEVDDLLQQLHRARTPQGYAAGDDDRRRLGSHDGSDAAPRAAGRSEGGSGAARPPLGANAIARHSAPLPRPARRNAGPPGSGVDTGPSSFPPSSSASTSEDDEDEDWDPSQATPHRHSHSQGLGRRRSNRLTFDAAAGPGAGWAGAEAEEHCLELPTCLDPNRPTASHAPPTAPSSSAHVVTDAPPGRSGRRRNSGTGQGAGGGGGQPEAWLEDAVLEDVNRGRVARGLPAAERLTVQLMKDSLRDRVMPDGRVWRAGSKTRDQLLADFATLLGEQQGTSDGAMPRSRPASRSGDGSPLHIDGSPDDSPMHALAQGTAFSAGGPSPGIWPVASSPAANLDGYPQPELVSQSSGMTPMSLLYIQKAQEARKRMADMRQSLPRGLARAASVGDTSPPIDGTVFEGRSGGSMRADGYSPRPISNAASHSGGSTPRLVERRAPDGRSSTSPLQSSRKPGQVWK